MFSTRFRMYPHVISLALAINMLLVNAEGARHSYPETTIIPHPTSQFNSTGTTQTAIVVGMNCIHARDTCMNDRFCRQILVMAPHVCGAEEGVCSTLTIAKCQAVLRTLQAYPYFTPLCTCDPLSYSDCNTFYDYLFHNPCSLIKAEDTAYPTDALPSCDYALDTCKKNPKCVQALRDFRAGCRQSEDRECVMEDADACRDAWNNLKLSPIFGCICSSTNSSCNRIFDELNYNPCVAELESGLFGRVGHSKPPPVNARSQTPELFQSTDIATISSIRYHGTTTKPPPTILTCLTALQSCRRDHACRRLLEQILHYCDPMRCRQETCMKALKKFYREAESAFALDVAFCMCRKTDNRHDQCRLAQEQLHPVCAQRVDLGVPLPACHFVAESCRSETECRFRLEEYEGACAVDSVARKCAGPAIECRNAMIRILGTKLRTSCGCNGTDFTQLYGCLGWQRILWVNPCVVQSQRDYHRLRATTTTFASLHHSSSTPISNHHPVFDTTEFEGEEDVFLLPNSFETTTLGFRNRKPVNYDSAEVVTNSSIPRYCRLDQNQIVREGQAKRLYPNTTAPTCSELCMCEWGRPEVGICVVLGCLEPNRCHLQEKTFNHYSHTEVPHRGKCLCYSGNWICKKPPQNATIPDNGVFLFLGFSRKDQQLLFPVTRLQARDVVQALNQLVSPQTSHFFFDENDPKERTELEKLKALNVTQCHLDLWKVEEENMIIKALAGNKNFSVTERDNQLNRDRIQCGPVLHFLRGLVNAQHPIIRGHALLSILKLAAVQDNIHATEDTQTTLVFTLFNALFRFVNLALV